MARLNIPTAIVFSAIGTGSVVGIATCTDDGVPTVCTIDGGTCPGDGRLCVKQTTHESCCPVCPVLGSCPAGCVLDFPPI